MATQGEDEDKDITTIEDDISETTEQHSDHSTQKNDDQIQTGGKVSPVIDAATSDMSVINSLNEDASDSVKTERLETESQTEINEIIQTGPTAFNTSDIRCEPCFAAKNAQKSPTGYCKECEEFLCDSCQKKHPMFRMFKDHKIIPAQEAVAIQLEPSKMCEQCAVLDISKEAKHVCPNCEDLLLCETCAQCHRALKSTKTHVLKDVSTFFTDKEKKDIYCDPCKMEDVASVACMFCPDCENEAMCEQCSKMHCALKKTRMHKLFDISELISNKTESEGKHSEPTANLFCEMCEVQGEKVGAVAICDDCGEYPICSDCREVHYHRKATRYHKLRDIKPLDSIENTLPMNRKYCEPCLDQQKCNSMKGFCLYCEQFLCKECIHRHGLQSITQDHTIKMKNKSIQATTPQYCDFCQIEGLQKKADAKCQDCDELLCSDCLRYHKIQKITKDHNVVTIQDASKDKDTPETMYCDNCKFEDKDEVAVAVCIHCDESALCEKCVSYHKKQKVTRGHILNIIKSPRTLQETSSFDDKMEEKKTSEKLETTCQKSRDIYEQPGQPFVTKIGSDALTLSWTKPKRFGSNDCFQVSLMDVRQNKWHVHIEYITGDNVDVSGLQSGSKYKFKVRTVYADGDGPYSVDSEVIETKRSPASSIINFACRLGDELDIPQSYVLPLTELRRARNTEVKTRRFEVGHRPKLHMKDKTIILLGETGTGKSTLVDGMANYVLGVHWEDPYRLKLINLEDEERTKMGNQAMSQTEWITCYTIHPMEGSRFPHTLNIIDTPGFGDTRGLERDEEVVQQMRTLFSSKEPAGVATLDAVCFLIKAPDARLTPMQSYIFQAVMSLFGKDIAENICSLITFADGMDPPVLSALKESGLPFGTHFNFNNSGLFANNTNNDCGSLAPMFWKMGMASFDRFFAYLDTLPTKSLQLTSDVLQERNRVEITVKNLQQKLEIGLMKIDELKTEMKIFDENKNSIKDNKNFKYTVTVMQQRKKDLPSGLHVTNCLNCNFTCHNNCRIADDEKKYKCSAMQRDVGTCKYCPENCHWKYHKNSSYVFDYVPVKEEKTYAEMQKKYEDASGKLPTQKLVLEKMQIELNGMVDTVEEMMDIVRHSNMRLAEIALRPNPLTMVEHIDLIIENEKMQHNPGWMKRIHTLREFRKRAQVTSDAESFSQVASSLGVTGNRKKIVKSKQNIFKRIKNTFGF
ncbi:TIF1A-like protein [Mya arenaria]|uniref:TIF1A-like protein n=1 Tax=Mya arenaria TaxID=6604 RepID=A0ABY7EJE6_MYAAR|nr:uncharacterized protein LOC128240090 isoform X2 [Mya arenaria]WAR10123.1 TIF1A-like protein [Mya arenaria]